MSARRNTDLCRICGGALQGNQRRWLFGSQSRRTLSSRRDGSLPRSLQSSPWGSTLSLGSSGSLSRSQQSLTSSSKGVDPLAVLTHILGQPVQRGEQLGEFICGKCVSLLERVFKFDSVVARVRVLSLERLQKLTQERDKIRQWVRQSYGQRHPLSAQSRGSASEDDGDKDAYREILRDNMALSEYECWSEKWDACPYFIRTGKRCRKGKGCEGCDSLRVSDSDYESVCGVPRHLPVQMFSPLSRDKSRSMPLHWQRIPSVSSSPASLAGSSLSLRPSSRVASIQSLDSLDGNDPFDFLCDPSVDLMLRELRGIEGKPVHSPLGSRIPVLGRRERSCSEKAGESVSPAVIRTLSFGDAENGDDLENEEDRDVLTELRDEFLQLHPEPASGRVHQAIRHLRGQLDQAQSRIRTLEAELKRGRSKAQELNGYEEWADLVQEEGGGPLLQSLGQSLHSRERLIQECLSLVRRLYVKDGGGSEQADLLTQELTANLQEILSDNKAALQALRSEMKEKEEGLEKEVEALRKAERERQRDLDTLNSVLLCNQDVLNGLREALLEKEQLLKEVEKERELWRRRDGALHAVIQEKEELIRNFKEHLEAVSSSVIGQQSEGGGAWLKAREAESALLCLEVTKLTAELQEYQDMVQTQQQSHGHALSSLTNQLQEARQQLTEKDKQKKEAQRAVLADGEERRREEARLKESLRRRDKLIEQILVDAEERDQLIRELQQNLQNKPQQQLTVTAVKHTL